MNKFLTRRSVVAVAVGMLFLSNTGIGATGITICRQNGDGLERA